MPWTAPTPPELVDGPLTGPDRAILEAFLAWQRHTLLSICAGLTGEQLVQRAVSPSQLTLLGLVRHLTKVERIWLRQRAAQEPVDALFPADQGVDTDFLQLDPDHAEDDLLRYQQECRLADVAVASMSFDATFGVHGQDHSLRLVYVHLIAEYSRHNGHADLLRERIDGRTGI